MIEGWVESIEVPVVQMIRDDTETFTKTLVMDNFTRPQKADCVSHVGIVGHSKNIVVGNAGFLFGGEVFMDVTDRVALYLHGCRSKWHAACVAGIDTVRVVHEISPVAALYDLLLRQVPGELMDDGAYHFQMGEFFRSILLSVNMRVRQFWIQDQLKIVRLIVPATIHGFRINNFIDD